MNSEDRRKSDELSEGQLWRLKKRYVLIVALENLCVRFKLMDAPDQTGERTLTGDIDTVFKNLQSFTADGGGDDPESVNEALNVAVTCV